MASSHINIRTRNKISAGVLIIRKRNNYTRGRKGAEAVGSASIRQAVGGPENGAQDTN